MDEDGYWQALGTPAADTANGIPSSEPSLRMRNPLLHMWSLGVEEQFYILWPLVIQLTVNRYEVNPSHACQVVVAGQRTSAGAARILVGIFSLSFATNLILCYALPDGTAAYYLPISRFWQLTTGALISWRQLKRRRNEHIKMQKTVVPVQTENLSGQTPEIPAPNVSERLGKAVETCASEPELELNPKPEQWLEMKAVLGVVMIAISIAVIDSGSMFPGWVASLPTLGTALVIHAGGESGTKTNALIGNSAFALIGRLSYPLYMWHWPVLVYGQHIYADLMNESNVSQSDTTRRRRIAVATSQIDDIELHQFGLVRRRMQNDITNVSCQAADYYGHTVVL